jgi:DNA-binding NarL/FixJ family response regulator
MPLNRPRILIADEHTLMADLCTRLLETEFEVIGTVSDGRAMVQAAAKLKPDVIIVDIAIPILNGMDAGRRVQAELPAVKLIFLAKNSDIELCAEAFRRGGARCLLLKTCTVSEMMTAVREVLRGKSYMSQTLCSKEVNFPRRTVKELSADHERLTERQREVLKLLAEGKTMKEVADVLNMATRTVAFHKYRMMETLCARSSAELVRYAVRHHIVAA